MSFMQDVSTKINQCLLKILEEFLYYAEILIEAHKISKVKQTIMYTTMCSAIFKPQSCH